MKQSQMFESGKQWATEIINEYGYSGVDDLYISLEEDKREYTASFSIGVSVVGMENEISSLYDYITSEDGASYRAQDWSRHNGDADVSSQVAYRESNIEESETEINELRTNIELIESKYK